MYKMCEIHSYHFYGIENILIIILYTFSYWKIYVKNRKQFPLYANCIIKKKRIDNRQISNLRLLIFYVGIFEESLFARDIMFVYKAHFIRIWLILTLRVVVAVGLNLYKAATYSYILYHLLIYITVHNMCENKYDVSNCFIYIV